MLILCFLLFAIKIYDEPGGLVIEERDLYYILELSQKWVY